MGSPFWRLLLVMGELFNAERAIHFGRTPVTSFNILCNHGQNDSKLKKQTNWKSWIRNCCDMELHPSVHPGEVALISQIQKWQQCRMMFKKGHRHRGLTAIDKVKPTTAHLLAVYAGKPVQGTMPKMLNYKGCVAYNWQEKT